MTPRQYTKEEQEFMKEYVPGHSHKEIRDEFLRRFGGEVPKSFPGSYIKNHNLNTGRTGYFKKDHEPWNKGKAMPSEQYDKCRATMFQPGSSPHNTNPVGTEKVLADGYIWIKIDDKPKAKKTENWIQKHRKVWQDANGPIPDGMCVIFLDGDPMNCSIDNLALVSRADHARLNQSHLRFTDPELTKSGVGIAKLKTAVGKRK